MTDSTNTRTASAFHRQHADLVQALALIRPPYSLNVLSDAGDVSDSLHDFDRYARRLVVALDEHIKEMLREFDGHLRVGPKLTPRVFDFDLMTSAWDEHAAEIVGQAADAHAPEFMPDMEDA